MSTELETIWRPIPQGESSLVRLAALLFLGDPVECSVELLRDHPAFNLQLVPRWAPGLTASKGATAQRSISVHRYSDGGTTLGAIVERGQDSAELSLVGALDEEITTQIDARMRGRLILSWLDDFVWPTIDRLRDRCDVIAQRIKLESDLVRYRSDDAGWITHYEIIAELREKGELARITSLTIPHDDAFAAATQALLRGGDYIDRIEPTTRGVERGAFIRARQRAARIFIEGELRRSGAL